MFEGKKYNQSDYLFLTKLFQVSENYNDMIKAINKYIELNPKLTKEEKKLFCIGYKNIISNKRNSFQILSNLLSKEDPKQANKVNEISKIKEKVLSELKPILQEGLSILDGYLIPNAEDNESKILYMKLKADFYRYRCEFSEGEEFEEAANNSRKLYKEAFDLAEKELPLCNEIRLGLVLNYTVFEFDIMENKKEAYDMALKYYNNSLKILDDDENIIEYENLLLIHEIKDNTDNWISEIEEE